jgi:hypothetical protein
MEVFFLKLSKYYHHVFFCPQYDPFYLPHSGFIIQVYLMCEVSVNDPFNDVLRAKLTSQLSQLKIVSLIGSSS